MSDLIDRQAAIEALMCTNPTEPYIDYDDAVKAIQDLPSAEKRGRWIEDGHYERCSECGEYADELHNYCPNCGARMEENE